MPLRGALCIGVCGAGGAPVEIAPPPIPDDGPQLTAKEIDEVVRARAGIFRACYQRQLNKTPELMGSVVLHFVIGGNGKVKSVKTSGGTMRDADVSRCMEYNTSLLQFPAHGGGAVVTYPFVFSSGS